MHVIIHSIPHVIPIETTLLHVEIYASMFNHISIGRHIKT